MSDVVEFQRMLLEDSAFRKRFAENPKAVLGEMKITLPPEVKLPSKIDAKVLEKQVDMVREGLEEAGMVDIGDVDPGNTANVSRVMREVIPLRNKDILNARRVHENMVSAGGDQATVAVVGAVVAAVVAVPVAVAGVVEDLAAEVTNPGKMNVTRGLRGLTLHGPNGIRIDGLSAAEAATIIRTFR